MVTQEALLPVHSTTFKMHSSVFSRKRMEPQVKVLASKPDNLSSIPRREPMPARWPLTYARAL